MIGFAALAHPSRLDVSEEHDKGKGGGESARQPPAQRKSALERISSAASGRPATDTKVCPYFQDGQCNWGAVCKFLHAMPEAGGKGSMSRGQQSRQLKAGLLARGRMVPCKPDGQSQEPPSSATKREFSTRDGGGGQGSGGRGQPQGWWARAGKTHGAPVE
ncbi:hypothetical protein CYMTET_56254 [Cymbomonas tetramitiformis]|uniref:C3H1-type domain-containing protein n=1 Tax=Cymbomonas tetramitiformis TaxID=36881 RepID=A0AAE0BD22_9CHLO|nr:hypothetical protein CYMTET_56254 [Cymbomonas tetramitiformis]